MAKTFIHVSNQRVNHIVTQKHQSSVTVSAGSGGRGNYPPIDND